MWGNTGPERYSPEQSIASPCELEEQAQVCCVLASFSNAELARSACNAKGATANRAYDTCQLVPSEPSVSSPPSQPRALSSLASLAADFPSHGRSEMLGQRSIKLHSARTILPVLIVSAILGQSSAQYHGDPDGIVFPGPISSRDARISSRSGFEGKLSGASELSKSLQLAREINTVETAEDFLSMVQGVPEGDKPFLLSSRFGGGEERSNAQRPKPAKCMPELQPVPLKQKPDPSTIYYPSCTRIMRCGGCCTHSLLSCQPIATEIRNFEVLVAKVEGSMGGLNYGGKQIVPLEEHTKCKCDCRMKPEHCTEKQTYVQEECRCLCSNIDEAEKCNKSNDTKLWDPDVCTCLCRTVQECNTGYYFDQNTCRCRQVPLSRSWFAPTKGADYTFGQTVKPEKVPPVIVALDASDPRRKPKDDPEYK